MVRSEQGHGERIDARSDLYSLGVMLFEMLAREKPFQSDNPMAIIYKHRKSPIPALPAHVSMFQPLVSTLLAKTPEERYPDAATAIEAIRASVREHFAEDVAAA